MCRLPNYENQPSRPSAEEEEDSILEDEEDLDRDKEYLKKCFCCCRPRVLFKA